MAHYQIISPQKPQLAPYIDHYMYVSGEGAVRSKKIFPRPGVSMVFDFKAPFYFGNNRFQKALSGLQHQPFTYASDAKRADHLVVQFSPYGFSRFINMPLDELTNHIIEPGIIFREDVHDLYEQIGSVNSLNQRVALIETFLLQRYSPPLKSDIAIHSIADQIHRDLHSINLKTIKEQTLLSNRQIERKFKAMIGVDMQSYIRISRFEHAKKLLLQNSSLRLTDVALEAGYYDQPHFSNDFKRISGVRPGKFEHCMEH